MRSYSCILKVIVVYALLGIVIASCIDKDTDYSRPDDPQTPNDFDYSTTQQVQLNVQYEVPEGYQVLFDVYFENPFEIDEEGQVVKRTDVVPKVTRMTDGNGKYAGLEVIPGYLDGDIYIYSSYIGVPTLYKTTLQGNKIQADISWYTMYDFVSAAPTRVESNFTYPKAFNILGDWDENGRPDYLDSEGALSLSQPIMNAINRTLPEDGKCPQKYRQSVDFEIKDCYKFDDLLRIMEILRAPDGCMWDREQDHHSIRRNFIEETYEVCEAIDDEDTEHMKEELGDVLLQVVFHTQMEKEKGTFDIDDVADGICKKLIFRHPHIFGNVEVASSEEVLRNWDDLKRKEKHQETDTQALESVAKSLPSLIRAEKLQKKAAKVGFDWDNVKDALDKVQEELDEVRRAIDGDGDSEEEIGDLLFASVNVARHLKID